ncbi:MAG: aminopeptidase P family protein [bacterium]
MHDERLRALREKMSEHGLSAWVAFDADPHGSEYVADRFRARSWLSGFHGSAGTLVVTHDTAGLWTDSRYFLEAESVLAGSEITLFKSGLTGTPAYPDWLAGQLGQSGGIASGADGGIASGADGGIASEAHGGIASGANGGIASEADGGSASEAHGGIASEADGGIASEANGGSPGVSSRPVVGIDAGCTSLAEFRRLERALSSAGVDVRASEDLVGAVWSDRPGFPDGEVYIQPLEFAGEDRAAKLRRVREHIRSRGAASLLLSSLDDIAWLTNLRGSDVAYNPVFLAFMLVSADSAFLFIDASRIHEETAEALSAAGIHLAEYSTLFEALASHFPDRPVLLSPEKTSVAVTQALPDTVRIIDERAVTTDMKAQKNETELSGVREAMRRDGRAMVRFLRRLEEQVPQGTLTELSAARMLEQLRGEEAHFVGPSFPTISGFRGHGAIVHYSVDEDSDVPLGEGMYLVDSGGQYRDGTTDITRTICFGPPPEGAVEDFTYVLKAHIALATIRFPEGTCGTQLDAVARDPMWRSGRDYGHGTGHGVGCFLNVHEGPQRIATRQSAVPLRTGMISSNEPGLYREGRYGIRIENLTNVVVSEQAASERFFEFETLTLCPVDTRLVDTRLLSDAEIDWINSYHLRVREALSPLLSTDDRRWLEGRTEPLRRSSADAGTGETSGGKSAAGTVGSTGSGARARESGEGPAGGHNSGGALFGETGQVRESGEGPAGGQGTEPS